jgi:hypothetical protein
MRELYLSAVCAYFILQITHRDPKYITRNDNNNCWAKLILLRISQHKKPTQNSSTFSKTTYTVRNGKTCVPL